MPCRMASVFPYVVWKNLTPNILSCLCLFHGHIILVVHCFMWLTSTPLSFSSSVLFQLMIPQLRVETVRIPQVDNLAFCNIQFISFLLCLSSRSSSSSCVIFYSSSILMMHPKFVSSANVVSMLLLFVPRSLAKNIKLDFSQDWCSRNSVRNLLPAQWSPIQHNMSFLHT